MDVQRKKGLLDICVLSVLRRTPSYGYQIIQDVSKCIEVTDSTMYPILRRLETNKCLNTYTQEHNGRTRKYYSITLTGIQRIQEFLGEWEEMKHIYNFIEAHSEMEEKEDE
ncbi:MAG: PadR family transcriptional regulator [Lachnospiraceae bacterium]